MTSSRPPRQPSTGGSRSWNSGCAQRHLHAPERRHCRRRGGTSSGTTITVNNPTEYPSRSAVERRHAFGQSIPRRRRHGRGGSGPVRGHRGFTERPDGRHRHSDSLWVDRRLEHHFACPMAPTRSRASRPIRRGYRYEPRRHDHGEQLTVSDLALSVLSAAMAGSS